MVVLKMKTPGRKDETRGGGGGGGYGLVWTVTSLQGHCLVRLQKISCTVVPNRRL